MFKLSNGRAKLINGRSDLLQYEKKVFSQNGEDGVTMRLISLLYNGDNSNKYYVEFGTESGVECNTRILRERYNWKGLQMDGGNENYSINLRKEFIMKENIVELFRKYNVPQNINVLSDYTTVKPTKNNILNALKDLLKSANAGDFLFFAYSGHGSYKADNNNDETTGYDQLICPLDFNMIVDDELKSIIQSNLKQGVTLFAMFDSCFSGTVLDLKYQYIDSLNYDNFTIHDRQLETQGDVFMISGCTDYQTSADAIINGRNNGAMTWSLLNSLKQKPNCTWRELIKNMRNLLKSSKFTQIPQFSCGKLENIDNKVFI
jgi:hypothetical protein